jgi:hypothetical protein
MKIAAAHSYLQQQNCSPSLMNQIFNYMFIYQWSLINEARKEDKVCNYASRHEDVWGSGGVVLWH